MARILSISSDVVHGHVGNAATRLALQRLGHQVWALPTVILSNHPGHAKVAGFRTEPERLLAMLDALAGNGWLAAADAVATGYLPTPDHVGFAAMAIARVRTLAPDVLVLVDPVLGDDPDGLYIDAAAAAAVRDRLVPLADIVTPNRFELAWLTGRTVVDPQSAEIAARRLGRPQVVATSIPDGDGISLATLLIGSNPPLVTHTSVARLLQVPHGTGDLLAALFLGRRLAGIGAGDALRQAVDGVRAAILASRGLADLDLVSSQAAWSAP